MVGDILQPTHLIFVLVVALLVLGPKRLPEVGRQLGNGLRDFRAAINGERPERPEEDTGPFEQSATEHELGRPSSETAEGHEFAHAASETSAGDHEFAHVGPETAAETHTFGHESPNSAGAPEPQQSAGEHEFAAKTSESTDKRTDPLS
jgi:sec-independent protein translocase protein TatA